MKTRNADIFHPRTGTSFPKPRCGRVEVMLFPQISQASPLRIDIL